MEDEKVSRTYLFSEFKLEQFDKRSLELEEVGAYREVISALDSYIDYVLLELLPYDDPDGIVIELFYKYNFIGGTQFKKILFSKNIIDGKLKSEIERFKSGRNRVVHNKHHIFALLPKDEALSGEFINRDEEREEIAFQEYNNLKELGREILEKLTKIWHTKVNPGLTEEELKLSWDPNEV